MCREKLQITYISILDDVYIYHFMVFDMRKNTPMHGTLNNYCEYTYVKQFSSMHNDTEKEVDAIYATAQPILRVSMTQANTW